MAMGFGSWTELTDANAEYMITADVTGDGEMRSPSTSAVGLWVWNDGTWGQISSMDPEYILSADTNGDAREEIMVDFGDLGCGCGTALERQPDQPGKSGLE